MKALIAAISLLFITSPSWAHTFTLQECGYLVKDASVAFKAKRAGQTFESAQETWVRYAAVQGPKTAVWVTDAEDERMAHALLPVLWGEKLNRSPAEEGKLLKALYGTCIDAAVAASST